MKQGVFLCHCGTNIAGVVDVPRLRELLSGDPDIAYITDLKYCCSEPGQSAIKEAVAEHGLDRVLVASCSPRMHETTFSRCIAQAGLNPYMIEMVNIREQCSWVTEDKQAATEKAYHLVKMGVAKARWLEPLETSTVPVVKRALVIGGGIAGITAALEISKAGYECTIVERTPTIGGKMAQLEKTFPTLDCSA